ncbi:MAG: hypothetical protein ACRCYU_23735 [Nocardioides sp.]
MAWGRTLLITATAVVAGLTVGLLGGLAFRAKPAETEQAPVFAQSPSAPVPVVVTVVADPQEPPALSPQLNYRQVIVGSPPFSSTVEVPQGWEEFPLEAGESRWTPPGNREDTHSLRVERVVSERRTTQQMVDTRADDLTDDTSITGLDILTRGDDSLTYSYINQRDRRRWGMLRWMPAEPGGLAELELSVTGRAMDRAGLTALLEHTAQTATQ